MTPDGVSDRNQVGTLPRPASRALNPYFLILAGAVLGATGEVLLAKGARSIAGSSVTVGMLGWFGPMASGWTWLGVISYVLSLACWLNVLRSMPLSIAFPLVNVVHVLVPAGAHLFLGETIPPRLWAGVALIFVGILVIARPLMKAEEKL